MGGGGEVQAAVGGDGMCLGSIVSVVKRWEEQG